MPKIARLILVITLLGCSSESSKIKSEFMSGCVRTEANKECCSCLEERIMETYSLKELQKINRSGLPPNSFVQFIQQTSLSCAQV